MPAYRPDFPTFMELARHQTLVPIARQLMGDSLTPVSAFGKLPAGEWAFLFESVVGGERIGRYSFLGTDPFHFLEAFGTRIRERGRHTDWTESTHPDPLAVLEQRIGQFRAPHLPGLPRFCGGAVGYAGYDTVRYVEHLPNAPTDDRNIPDLSFAFYDRMVIFDHITKTIHVVAHVAVPAEATDAELKQCYQNGCGMLDTLVGHLQQPGPELPLGDIDPTAGRRRSAGEEIGLPERFASNMSRERYNAAVEKVKEYIHAGDAFQVVFSQRFRTQTTAEPLNIYRALRVVNPSPFMFFVRSGPVTLIGASPEIMCRVEDGTMTVRPLAGTRRRGATEAEDAALAQELHADPKERAEHIMLVDLGRNDVGRVAKLGSVEISDLLTVEKYSHVMHLSSTVTGQLATGKTAFDAMRASLPAGTLSGAPKVRAMQIIDELEPTRRGPYGGAVGYIDFSGNMDTCIALRTLVLVGTTADVQAGGGLVADSDVQAEYQETVNKATSLLRAIEVAEQQL